MNLKRLRQMKDNEQEMLPLVSETGAVVGSATRGFCHSGSMVLHPVVHLHLFNPRGELYLQQRPLWKDIQPGRWDTAVGGHMDCGETPLEALRREAREEIGVEVSAPRLLERYVFESRRERELVYVYTCVSNAVPRPSAEVAGGRYFAREEVERRLGTGFFTPNFEQEWRRFFAARPALE